MKIEVSPGGEEEVKETGEATEKIKTESKLQKRESFPTRENFEYNPGTNGMRVAFTEFQKGNIVKPTPETPAEHPTEDEILFGTMILLLIHSKDVSAVVFCTTALAVSADANGMLMLGDDLGGDIVTLKTL